MREEALDACLGGVGAGRRRPLRSACPAQVAAACLLHSLLTPTPGCLPAPPQPTNQPSNHPQINTTPSRKATVAAASDELRLECCIASRTGRDHGRKHQVCEVRAAGRGGGGVGRRRGGRRGGSGRGGGPRQPQQPQQQSQQRQLWSSLGPPY